MIHTPQTITSLSVAALIPYARNSRTHSDEQVAQIAASIREYGFTNPILIDGAGGIIAGHGRVLAARCLGLTEVPCIRLDHLTEAQKRAYVIADNKLALNAGWDDALLAQELKDLAALDFDLSLTGFASAEIDGLFEEEVHTLSAAALRALETETDAEPKTEEAFQREMADTAAAGKAPIVPMYAEHHQAFVIVCDNSIDEAWLRNRLKLEGPRQSYKDQKIIQANVLTVAQLKAALQ